MGKSKPALKLHTRKEIESFIGKHEARYGWYDQTIQTLLDAFPDNTDYSSVLNKVVVINRLYSTSIYDVDGTAHKILNLNFDARIADGDLSLVHEIASPDPAFSKNNRYTYSFATKYCNWHAKEVYPHIRFCCEESGLEAQPGIPFFDCKGKGLHKLFCLEANS